MRQRLGLVMIGAIALAMTGCASESPPPAATSPAPAASTAPAPAGSPAAGQQPFAAKPLVAQKPATTAAVPGLIQPTNADERVKRVQANINKARTQKDPFASVPVPVQSAGGTQTTTGSTTSSGGVPPLPSPPQPGALPGSLTAATPFTSRRPTGATPPRPSSPFPPRVGTNPNTTNRPGRGTPTAPAAPVPPPPPVLADATEVSGIAYVGGQAQAIVKAPNEPTSRYVRVGQRLSDGQILVKRIELNAGADPIVVLEQNGVEVSKVVGEKAAPAPGSPAA